jgi:uncharacterized protein involved in exopolysaccharide biosynthesis
VTVALTLVTNAPDPTVLEGAIFDGVCVVIAALLGLIATLMGIQRRHAIRAAAAAQEAVVKAKEVQTSVTTIKNQVQNGHNTNLRDDVDGLTSAVADLTTKLGETHAEVAGLRSEMSGIRTDQTADRQATNNSLDALRRAILGNK